MSRDRMIHLGYEIQSGRDVAVPLRHMAVTGQTQQSGKTTTLEAMVDRSGQTALTFVTKRGESAFAHGFRVQPYFRDRADWQFVSSIIDATLQEKNKFLRPWIMKICRTTRSLVDVQEQVHKALRKAKGIHEGVYTQLDAYLDLIVPEIQRADLARELWLRDGLNVMDVSGFATPMQMLFVQSALDWVNAHSHNTIVVVPEAWEFIPESKGSPVKSSAIALVRKGAAIGNYIWVDSQDMAGVDKTILRGCTVWLIGVQREANEIKRNLSNIPAGIKKPNAADVATLTRGQFFACFEAHVIRTYVQPAWVAPEIAREVAQGRIDVADIGRLYAKLTPPREDDAVTPQEADALKRENVRLQNLVDDLQRQINELRSPGASRVPEKPARQMIEYSIGPTGGGGSMARNTDDLDALYAAIKVRALEDAPVILKLLALQPSIDVEVERVVIKADAAKQPGQLALMITQKFFDQPVDTTGVVQELRRRGRGVHNANVARDLNKLAEQGFLTVEDSGYRAVPGMKINIVEA